MANKKISELTQTTSLTGEELVPIVSNGQNKAVKVKYLTEVPTKVSELENDKGYLTSIPSEYVTETELENKDYATETFVINKITEAQLDGGEVNLDGLATKDDLNTKVDKVNGKGLSTNDYTTQEKNKLSGIENNANNYVHPEKHNASMIDGLANVAKSGSYNDLTNKPTIPSIQGLATEQYVDNAIANTQLGGGEISKITLEMIPGVEFTDSSESAEIKVVGVTVTDNIMVNPNNSTSITASIQPYNATNKNVTWSCNNNNVTLNPSGLQCLITGVNLGSSVITVTTQDGGFTDECQVTITDSVTPLRGISLNKTSSSLNIGETEQLEVIYNPSDATNKNIVWTSSHVDVVTVDNGLVVAIGSGNGTITATSEDGGFIAMCDYTVAKQSSDSGTEHEHNLIDWSTVTKGYVIINGAWTASNNYQYMIVNVKPNTQYAFQKSATYEDNQWKPAIVGQLAYLTSNVAGDNSNIISGVDMISLDKTSDGKGITFTTPDNCEYITFTVPARWNEYVGTEQECFYQLEEGDTIHDYYQPAKGLN